ncbi:peptidase domain-containing ABC transporter [Pararhodospirillum photometricum]|uniref:ABC transporter, ATP-binding protein n=1 Tax=Pararhodospirillum photometricum DSM 122 TaxID=1150469 RepID=H6SQ62_PARPM|nr:ABC transporter transmembrane domain-containing protein [Pararhodospirillum photometricum]CCG09581.1 ABC transporter, ATP-binding protein [Pararhodospirillum photometricum DSM 122]
MPPAASSPSVITRASQLVAGQRRIGELLLTSLLINVVGLAMPLAMLQVYDRILPNANVATLDLLVLGVGAAIVVEMFLRHLREDIANTIAARFESRGQVESLTRLLRMPMSEFERVGGGTHLERLTAVDQMRDQVGGRAFLALMDLPFVGIYLGVIYFLGQKLVLIPVGLALLFAIITVIQSIFLRRVVEETSQQDERRHNFMIETLGGIHTVKALAAEAQMLRRFERLLENTIGQRRKAALRTSSVQISAALFSQATSVILVAGGALLVMDNRMTVGSLAACTMLAGRITPIIQGALGVWQRHQTTQVAQRRVASTLAIPDATQRPPFPPASGAARLVLENLTYGTHGTDNAVLNNVNLTLEPGDCISLRGGNGSGKSLLLWLMTGQISPDKGRVLLDGTDLGTVDPSSLDAHIGYVSDQGQLLQGTLIENLTLFDRDREAAAMAVAEELGLNDVAAYLSQGFEARLGGRIADILPRGVVQRVAIARVLTHDPRLILFDDAAMLLDGSAETLLMDAIRRRKGTHTLVIVSHRPSTLKIADRHFEVVDGTLKESPLPGRPVLPPAGGPIS